MLMLILSIAGMNPALVNPNPATAMAQGVASWYAEFSPGINVTTANMEVFDHEKMTCAMWEVPFNSMVRVTNLENGKKIIVRVNDRGPARRYYRKGRIIDLTRAAFEKIAPPEKGLVKVRIEILR